MLTLNANQLKDGRFSWYIDYNCTETYIDKKGKQKERRKRERLNVYTQKKYNNKTRSFPSTDEKTTWLTLKELLTKKQKEFDLKEDGKPDLSEASFIEFMKIVATKRRHGYQNCLNHVIKFANGTDLLFKDIDFNKLEQFVKYLSKQDTLCNNTVIEYMKVLRATWNYARKKGVVDNYPFKRLDAISYQDKELVYLTLEEVKAMENAKPLNEKRPEFTEIVRKMFIFRCVTGIRHSEAKELEWDDINFKKGYFTYYPAKLNRKKKKVCYLGEKAIRILESIPDKKGLVFKDIPTDNSVRFMLTKLRILAGIGKHIATHTARHTFAVTFYLPNNIGDIYGLSQALGHESIKVTQDHYAHIVDESRKAAVMNLPTW